MQPPRRPPTRPPSNQGMQGMSSAPRDAGTRLPRPESQHVVRKPQMQATQTAWLLRRRRLRPKHVVAVLGIVCVFFLAMMAGSARIRTLSTELEQKKADVKEALLEVSEKERLLQFSGTDEYIEQQARLRFGYINEGEIRFLPDVSLTNDFGGY